MNNSADAIVDRVETRVLGVVCGVLIGLGFCLFLLGLLIKKYPGINRRLKLMIYLSLILLHERLNHPHRICHLLTNILFYIKL